MHQCKFNWFICVYTCSHLNYVDTANRISCSFPPCAILDCSASIIWTISLTDVNWYTGWLVDAETCWQANTNLANERNKNNLFWLLIGSAVPVVWDYCRQLLSGDFLLNLSCPWPLSNFRYMAATCIRDVMEVQCIWYVHVCIHVDDWQWFAKYKGHHHAQLWWNALIETPPPMSLSELLLPIFTISTYFLMKTVTPLVFTHSFGPRPYQRQSLAALKRHLRECNRS